MIVRQPRLCVDGSEARIVAPVESETDAFEPFELIIVVPRPFVGWLDTSGNALVPTLLLLAGMLRERLVVEAPVSSRLLQGAQRASELYESWWQVAPVVVEAEEQPEDGQRAGSGAALFFTRGVDSWFTGLRGRKGELPERLTHLLYVPCFDRNLSPTTRRGARQRTEEAAAFLGFPLIAVRDNARDLLDRFVDWSWVYGGVLTGVGLALGSWFGQVVMAASQTREQIDIPMGSHPLLDACWSTEQTTFRLDGLEHSRTDKVKAIGKYPGVLSRLKVCWHENTHTNCGRCEKCVRTQCALAIAGIEPPPGVFHHPLTPELVATVHRRDRPPLIAFWEELYRDFPLDPALAELREAVKSRLPASHPEASTHEANGLVDFPPLPVEAAEDTAVALLSASARALLPGPVTVYPTEKIVPASEPCLELTWGTPAPGRLPLPLRPTREEALEILAVCRSDRPRPISWCLIDIASGPNALLLRRLTEAWGPGVSCLPRSAEPGSDHGTPRPEATRIQQASAVRVWWGSAHRLDPFRVLEALRHGCLPLQVVGEEDHDSLIAPLPAGLEAFTLSLPRQRALPVLNDDERTERLNRGLSVLLAGTLERDLERTLSQLKVA